MNRNKKWEQLLTPVKELNRNCQQEGTMRIEKKIERQQKWNQRIYSRILEQKNEEEQKMGIDMNYNRILEQKKWRILKDGNIQLKDVIEIEVINGTRKLKLRTRH